MNPAPKMPSEGGGAGYPTLTGFTCCFVGRTIVTTTTTILVAGSWPTWSTYVTLGHPTTMELLLISMMNRTIEKRETIDHSWTFVFHIDDHSSNQHFHEIPKAMNQNQTRLNPPVICYSGN